MMCKMNRDIDRDPMYWLGASFFSGFLFSTWSWGILYLLVFLIAYELFLVFYKGWKEYDLQIRIGVVCGAIMGFLIGRAITENDDHEKEIQEFKSVFKKYLF